MDIKIHHLLVGLITTVLVQTNAFALSAKKLEKYYPSTIGEYTRAETIHGEKNKTISVSYKRNTDLPYAVASFSMMPALLSYKGFLDMDRAVYIETFPSATLKTNRMISFHHKKIKYHAAKYIYRLPAKATDAGQDIYAATYLWQYRDRLFKLQVSCLYEDKLSVHAAALLFLKSIQWKKRV